MAIAVADRRTSEADGGARQARRGGPLADRPATMPSCTSWCWRAEIHLKVALEQLASKFGLKVTARTPRVPIAKTMGDLSPSTPATRSSRRPWPSSPTSPSRSGRCRGQGFARSGPGDRRRGARQFIPRWKGCARRWRRGVRLPRSWTSPSPCWTASITTSIPRAGRHHRRAAGDPTRRAAELRPSAAGAGDGGRDRRAVPPPPRRSHAAWSRAAGPYSSASTRREAGRAGMGEGPGAAGRTAITPVWNCAPPPRGVGGYRPLRPSGRTGRPPGPALAHTRAA